MDNFAKEMDFLFLTMNSSNLDHCENADMSDPNSGEITPFIKEELKWTILSKRHKEGLGDIEFEERKPSTKCELTEREKERRERRKAQNRRAAERCRKKKQKMNEQLHQDYVKEQKKTELLIAEVNKLRQEKAHLQSLLDNHAFSCRQNVTPNTTPGYDQNTTFDFPSSCSAPFQVDLRQDVQTPFQQDPFEDAPFIPGENSQFYPEYTALKPQTTFTSAIMGEEPVLPELDLSDDLDEVFQPVSPDMRLGRQSISDYLDEEFLNQ